MHLERQVNPFDALQGRGPRAILVTLAGVLASLPLAVVLEGTWALPIGIACGLVIGITVTRVWTGGHAQKQGSPDLAGHVRTGSKLAVLDPRSGLLQRWYLDLRLAEESERCRRHGLTMTMMFIRLAPASQDGGARESTLVEEAQLLVHSLRRGDLAARIAPDSYTLCLMHADEWQARTAVRRILGGLRHKQAVDVRLAVCPEEGTDVDSLFRVARSVDVNEQPEAPAPRRPHGPQESLPKLLMSQATGSVPVRPEETPSQAKARLRRASKRAGISLNVWQEEGVIRFERVEEKASA